MPAAFLACMAVVSAFYQLPPRVLPSIQAVEAGRPGLVSANSNGSEDLGVMQINTLWIPPLARQTGQSPTEVRDRLIHDPCFNIAAAGAILRLELDAADGDLLRAVGNYHSRTPSLHKAYRGRVLDAADRLFGAPEWPTGRPLGRPNGRQPGPPPPPLPKAGPDQSHR